MKRTISWYKDFYEYVIDHSDQVASDAIDYANGDTEDE